MRNHLFVGVAAIAVVASAPAYAQETTSSVRGTVVSGGQAVAGADVSIVHEPSGTMVDTTTNDDGSFSFNGLRVGGPFTITAKASGFEDSKITGVSLSAGQATRVSVNLEQASEIVVTASRTNTLEKSTGPITSLGREDIDGVASINRDIRDLARRDPFVTMDLSNARTIEIAGNNGRLNRFSVDGVQFSDDFGLNNGGLPTSRGPVPFDAIEQFSVKVAPYDISEGDFQGGAINVVLRSGGNKFKGDAFFSYTDDKLTGDKTRGTPINLDFDSKQYGGVLSGPIIKDKLFFMLAYERTKETDPFDNGVGSGFAAQVPGVTTAQIDQVSSIAKSVYNFDTLGLSPNAAENDEKLVAKLDWNVSDDHRASVTYIRNVGTQQFQQNTFITAPFAIGLQSNGYELAEEVNSGVFQLNSNWSDDLSSELRVAYRDYNRDQTPFGGRNFGQFEVCLDPTSTGATTSCNGTRVFFGPDVSRHSNDLGQTNFSGDLTLKYQAGDHSIKATFGYTKIDTFNLFLQRSLGDFYFDSVADFQAQRANRLRYANAVPSLDPANAAANYSSTNYTFGLQNDWQINDKLQLTYGARYDLFDNSPGVPLNPNFLTRYGFTNTATFKGRGVFQPRMGINFTPTDKLILRGGVGIFAGGTPDVFLSNSFSNTGQLTNALDIQRNTTAAGCNVVATNAAAICASALNGVNGSTIGAPVTGFLTTNVASLAAAPTNAINQNLKIARQLKASFSADYEADLGPLGEGWLFGAEFLYSKNIYGYNWIDLRSVGAGTLPDGRLRYGPFAGSATTNQDLLMTNSTRGRSLLAAARFSKSWDVGLSIEGSYTRSNVKDENAITSSTAGSLYGNNAFVDSNRAAYGRSIYEYRDQWKFGVEFNRKLFGDYKTRLGFFGEYRSGRPYSLTMLDNSGGRLAVFGTVGNAGRQLLYVPTTSDTRVSFDTVASETAFNTLVTNLGIEKFRGRIVPKNSATSPDFFKVDLNFSQELPGGFKGGKFKLFADIENVLNLIDSDWGALRQVSFPYTASLARVACLTAPVATGTAPTAAQTSTSAATSCAQYRYSNILAPNEALVSRQSLYGIRVGIRYSF
jgi:hypothetical protein